MLYQVFITTAGLSFTAAVMVLIVLIIRGACAAPGGMIGRQAFVVMWLLIFCRAAVPFTVDAKEFNPTQWLYQSVMPAATVYSPEPSRPASGGEPGAFVTGTVMGTAGVPASAPGTVKDAPTAAVGSGAAAGDAVAAGSGDAAALAPAFGAGAAISGGVQYMLRHFYLLWALVAAVLLLLIGFTYLATLWQVRRLPDWEVPAGAAALRDRLEVRPKPRVKRGVSGGTAVYGIFRPIIVVDDRNIEHIDHILAHELIHIRQHDNLKQLIARIVIALHWFNPLLWLAGRLMQKDIELACDQRVLKALGSEERKAYAGALYDCARQQSAASRRGFAYFGTNPVKARVKNVLAFRGRTVTAPVIAAALAVFVLAGCMADPAAGWRRESIPAAVPSSAEGAITGYEAAYAFYRLQLPHEAGREMVDYYPDEQRVYYIYNEADGSGYGLGYADIGSGNNQWLFTGAGRQAYGRLHLARGVLYCCVREPGGGNAIMAYDLDRREAAAITLPEGVGGPGDEALLYGDEDYLCWYENGELVIWQPGAGAGGVRVLATNGAQGYANILDGYVALQRDGAGPGGGTDVVRHDLSSGNEWSVGSVLPETRSVYANKDYIVYKEDYRRGAEIAVYRMGEDKTYLLWDALEGQLPADEWAALKSRAWGINLLHDRLFLTGADNAILSVKLDDFTPQVIADAGNHGTGFYEAKVAGHCLTAVQALPGKNNGDSVLSGKEPVLFYAAVLPVSGSANEPSVDM
ncbi:MAG: M56 family metallopeptidase [Syntrophomonadaceae bacterium]|nr:M56 family metallopeptidase [Syntrophomonadaceae bacterium]